MMDFDEAKARREICKAAKEQGLNVFGGKMRRTSSRFCLSVEHGDYNGTELFGVGTDRFIWFAYKPNGTSEHRLFSVNFPEDGVVKVPCGSVSTPPKQQPIQTKWAHFAFGVDYVLKTKGFSASASSPKVEIKNGIDGVLYGNIPGGGMSRSASLTVNLLISTLESNGIDALSANPMLIVDLSQAVENEYTGSPCGNLDQVMIVFAKEGFGTHYYPSQRKVEHVQFGGSNESFRLLVLDTGTTRAGLETSTYSIRARECKELCTLLGISHLGNIHERKQLEEIHSMFGKTHPNLISRLDYIFEAQERFGKMLQAWKSGDIMTVGKLFRLDGIGLRDQYVISGPELEAMNDIVRCIPGVFGERMLGGGDKGASGCICLPESVSWIRSAINTSYPAGHPLYANKWAVHECKFVQGVTLLSPLSDS